MKIKKIIDSNRKKYKNTKIIARIFAMAELFENILTVLEIDTNIDVKLFVFGYYNCNVFFGLIDHLNFATI